MTNIEGRRKHIPRKIYTPTQQPSAINPKYYLLLLNEIETYQIVAKSNIKCVDDHGSTTITIRNKQLKGKTILTGDFLKFNHSFQSFYSLSLGSFDECEKEMSRRTRLSQQDNNNGIDSEKGDDDVENDAATVDTQHRVTTQSHFAQDSSAVLDFESSRK
ncbi:unnamed protein product [Rotaria sp. Silwood2]|nr:unnamed protein product [Rotaria sp. Silwood2]